MIASFRYNHKRYKLIDKIGSTSQKNVFTILVGKNGTGKSRFLSSIITTLLTESKGFLPIQNLELEFYQNSEDELHYNMKPKKIIAVSTSPFDKFPLTRYRKPLANYSYLGIRDLTTQNYGLGYMSKIIDTFIEVIVGNPKRMKEVTNVLKHLGYTDRISIRFHNRFSNRIISELSSAKDPYLAFESMIKNRPAFFTFNKRFFENDDHSLSKSKISYLVKLLNRIRNSNELSKGYSVVEIDKNGIYPQYSFKEYFKDLVFLIQSGIIKLNDIVLEKIGSNSIYSIVNASSGEQSSIISILGIASQISDNSLICIDEPEICLHPEWQEKYIKLLIETFDNYRNCHFVIATHSPQIISNLSSDSSFVLSMETGETISAKKLIKQSADFQLANVFNSPGFKNEFLSRIALNTFTKVLKNKVFEKEDTKNFELLKMQSEFMVSEDPLIELINALKEMYKIYA